VTDNIKSLAERLRDTVEEEAGHELRNEAADLIEQQAARIAQLETQSRAWEDAAKLAERTVSELEADRDSWRDQASERVKDWDQMRQERDVLNERIAELEEALKGATIIANAAGAEIRDLKARLAASEPKKGE
jgi:uncharacterized coiled-coil DUF342 family protein